MIKSMTGFGQGEASNELYGVQVELKSVNHRYLDLFFRISKQYSQLEEVIRSAIQGRIARGRVEVMVSVEDFGSKERTVAVNRGLLQGYLQALQQLQRELGSTQTVKLEQILLLPDVLELKEAPLDFSKLQELCSLALEQALGELEQMRQREGRSLQENLCGKVVNIEALLKQVQEIAPLVVEEYRQRLQSRLAELLDGTTITEERFLGEVALFAEKSSIDEELVRLTSHIQQLKDSLRSSQPVGRRLDFLIQEINREVNTIGSKAGSAPVARLVVDLKSELEKIREQVQNIE